MFSYSLSASSMPGHWIEYVFTRSWRCWCLHQCCQLSTVQSQMLQSGCSCGIGYPIMIENLNIRSSFECNETHVSCSAQHCSLFPIGLFYKDTEWSSIFRCPGLNHEAFEWYSRSGDGDCKNKRIIIIVLFVTSGVLYELLPPGNMHRKIFPLISRLQKYYTS